MLDKARKRLSLTFRVLARGRQTPQAQLDIPPISPEEVAEAKAFFPARNSSSSGMPVPARPCWRV